MNEDERIIDNQEETEEQAPANETKAEKFLRLAPPRINKVIGAIQSLGKLSSNSYEYTPEQTEKMFAAIRKELDECETSFKPKEKKEDKGFTF